MTRVCFAPRVAARMAVLGAWALMWFAPAGQAETIRVPVDQPTIQAAIDAAAVGDEVVVSAGIYFENIVFRGRDIVVRSRGGVAATIIDGGGAGPVVTFTGGESQDCILDGFTLRGGVGVAAEGYVSVGGGLHVVGAWPVIRACTIRECSAERGGGVYVGGVAQDATKLLSCVIEDNAANFGGGIFQEVARLEIFDCLVRRNTATIQGGGFHSRPLGGTTSIYQQSVIEHNVSGGGGGGGTFVVEGDGVYLVGESLFRENTAAGPGGGLNIISHATGGGAAEHGNVGACDFLANRASRGGAIAYTATSDATQGRHTIHRCLFARNVADGHDLGGALWVSQSGARVRITSSTLVDNVAAAGGGALYAQGTDGAISAFQGCLVWGHGATPFAGELAAAWSYQQSDVEGGAPAGAVSEDVVQIAPRFYDPRVFDYSVADDDPTADYGSENGNDDPWSVIRSALPGREGYPNMKGAGALTPGTLVWMLSSNLPAGSPGLAFVGFAAEPFELFGGTLVPTPQLALPFTVSPLGGGIGTLGTLPLGTPAGLEFFVQAWALDRRATQGWVATDTIKFRTR